jgi:hypothetical protein
VTSDRPPPRQLNRFGDRSVRGSTDPSTGARSMDLAHLVVDVGY